MFDSHTHTNNSPDSKQSIDDLCTAAIEKGVKGVAITDHAHLSPIHENFFDGYEALKSIKNSILDAKLAKEKYKGELKVFTGVEIGEVMHDLKKAKKILSLADYDIIIGSVHYIKDARWELQYSKINFADESITDEEISGLVKAYFDELISMIDCIDFDVLAHINAPFRYICDRHGRKCDITQFEEQTDEI